MTPVKLVKKIRNYAIASFLVPLIAINSCLLIYKYLGDIKIKEFPNLNWNQNEHTYTYEEFKRKNDDLESHRFTFCPKHHYATFYTSIDNQTLLEDGTNLPTIENLKNSNKIKFVTIVENKQLNKSCIKNHQAYSLIKKFSWLDKILVRVKVNNSAGFAKIKNPYFYGEVSISRTARYFPSILIFKTLIILSAFILFIYWKNNLNLLSELKNRNIFGKFSKKFFYLGIFSCIFLALHATFLGLDIDSKPFNITRRLIIILFILFEVFAQILLTKNLFKFKEELKKYINPLILKIKIVFVITVFFTTCIAFVILAFGDPSTALKHALEWNYFAFLLLYYLLSRLLWK